MSSDRRPQAGARLRQLRRDRGAQAVAFGNAGGRRLLGHAETAGVVGRNHARHLRGRRRRHPEPSDTFPFTVPLLRSMAPDFTTTVTLLWVIAEE